MFLAREISSLLSSDPSPESPGLISVPHWRVLPGEDAGLNVCCVMLKLLLTSAKRAVMLRAAFPLGCGGGHAESSSVLQGWEPRQNMDSTAGSLGLQTSYVARLPQFPSEAKYVLAEDLLKLCLHCEAEGGGNQGKRRQQDCSDLVGVGLHSSAWSVFGETAQPAWTVPLCPRAVMQRLFCISHTLEQVQGVRCGGWTSPLSPASVDAWGCPASRMVDDGLCGVLQHCWPARCQQCGRDPALLGDSAGTPQAGLCQP